MVATVTMKVGIRRRAEINPFANPASAPTIRVTKMASGPLSPHVSERPRTRPDKAAIDPTERSISPIINTNVIPNAMIAMIETWDKTVNILFVFKK